MVQGIFRKQPDRLGSPCCITPSGLNRETCGAKLKRHNNGLWWVAAPVATSRVASCVGRLVVCLKHVMSRSATGRAERNIDTTGSSRLILKVACRPICVIVNGLVARALVHLGMVVCPTHAWESTSYLVAPRLSLRLGNQQAKISKSFREEGGAPPETDHLKTIHFFLYPEHENTSDQNPMTQKRSKTHLHEIIAVAKTPVPTLMPVQLRGG